MKHFIDLKDITAAEMMDLLDLADQLKADLKAGRRYDLLRGKTLGMIFAKSSTRTRISFEVGMAQLGGQALYLNAQDIQLGRGESVADTARVLSRFLDAIMIRTYAHQDVLDLAAYGTIPIINGLTDLMHPCQALADLMTIREHKGTLKGLKLAYLGDGNNVANALLQACARVGMDVAVAAPEGYTCDPACIADAREQAALQGSQVILTEDPAEAASQADVLYTDTWVSMGQEGEKAERVARFSAYQVNEAMMAMARPGAIFLHCLPAYRGLEVTSAVIDGPASVIFDEAENRLHAQKAILIRLLNPQ
ncbi:MAG: ornithine carbamoyltransferase [Clostridiaceae bacterium]|jgi:ornithine carbamoyltransferase|nr:ornithine carbamoyltransferase [Clostridiaceae bacterium]